MLLGGPVHAEAVLVGDLEVVVGAVVEQRPRPPAAQRLARLEAARLDVLGGLGEHGEGPVDLVGLEGGRLGQLVGELAGRALGPGLDHAAPDQPRQHRVEVEAEPPAPRGPRAGLGEAQLVVDGLQEQVADVERRPRAALDEPGGVVADGHPPARRPLLGRHLGRLCACPRDHVRALGQPRLQLGPRPQPLHDLRRAPARGRVAVRLRDVEGLVALGLAHHDLHGMPQTSRYH